MGNFLLEEKITILAEYAGVSFETINCMTAINGYCHKTLADILYWKTGYTDFNKFMREWEEDEISEFDE